MTHGTSTWSEETTAQTSSGGLNGIWFVKNRLFITGKDATSTKIWSVAPFGKSWSGSDLADGDTIVYSIASCSLPGRISLNSSTCVISGDPTNVSASTTSTFTARVTANSKTTDRTFAIVVTPTNYFGNGSDGALST